MKCFTFSSRIAAVALAAALFAAGCKKSEPPPPVAKAAPRSGVSINAEGDAAAVSGGAPAPVSPALVAAEDPGPAPVKLAEPMMKINPAMAPEELAQKLTDAVNVFEDWYGGKAPGTLQQLVEKRIIDQIPAAPAGMKFVINPQRHAVELKAE